MIIITLTFVFTTNGRIFRSEANSGRYSDGVYSGALQFYTPAQSDITTIISLLASLTRVSAGLWISDLDWRCTFLFMLRGGITVSGTKRMLEGWPLLPQDTRRISNFLSYTVILIFAVWSTGLLSPILTGSISWREVDLYVEGGPLAVPLPRAAETLNVRYLAIARSQNLTNSVPIYSWRVWGPAGNRTLPGMVRVIGDTNVAPKGIRISKATVPRFAVDSFLWIEDPTYLRTTKEAQLRKILRMSDIGSPDPVSIGFLPDDEFWGPNRSRIVRQEGGASLVLESELFRETRTLVLKIGDSDACDQDQIGIPSDVGRLGFVEPDSEGIDQASPAASGCFAFANVTFSAGASLCPSATVDIPAFLQCDNFYDNPFLPDSLTSVALDMIPYVASLLIRDRDAMPSPPQYNSTEHRSIELLSRAYQMAWNSYTSEFGEVLELAEVQVPILMSRMGVELWRVLTWAVLHLFSLTIGTVFAFAYPRTGLSWSQNPSLIGLATDTRPLASLGDWGSDPWKAGTRPPSGVLILQQQESSHSWQRQVQYRPLNSPSIDEHVNLGSTATLVNPHEDVSHGHPDRKHSFLMMDNKEAQTVLKRSRSDAPGNSNVAYQ
jgi:hypothetical protein